MKHPLSSPLGRREQRIALQRDMKALCGSREESYALSCSSLAKTEQHSQSAEQIGESALHPHPMDRKSHPPSRGGALQEIASYGQEIAPYGALPRGEKKFFFEMLVKQIVFLITLI